MSQLTEIKVPDIGDYTDVDVIAVEVKVGDTIAVDDTLITLETDKATMDVPADTAGVVKELKIKVGDKVSEGSVILVVEASSSADNKAEEPEEQPTPQQSPAPQQNNTVSNIPSTNTNQTTQVVVPDIGNFTNVDVIAVEVKVGDTVAVDDTLITLETDKATMDVPCTVAGTVTAVFIKVGDKVSEGNTIIDVATTGSQPAPAIEQQPAPTPAETKQAINTPPVTPTNTSPSPKVAYGATPVEETIFNRAHAGPAVRKLARELGVDLSLVKGSARKGRIIADDVKAFVKNTLKSSGNQAPSGVIGSGLNLLPWPQVDFTKFGEIETQPLPRIKKISGQNLARNWVMIPHVTQHDDADMTDLEAFRKSLNQEWSREGVKLSPLAFIVKACVKALQTFPEFNSSLDGENLILKKYIHIGFAADTPNGLVVPVIRNADQKGLKEIAIEMAELSKKAREGKLKPQEMQGASFTISSLGGIGGTYFTPIINAPEVAILGVCKAQVRPVWNGQDFEPRLMCPLSLSYDHRVIDGAAACRFITFLGTVLKDFRRAMI